MSQERMQCTVNVFHICSCQCWVHAVLARNSAFPLSKVEADLVWTSLNHIHCIIIYIYHNTYVYIYIINISIHILNDPQRHMVQLLSGGQWITALDLLQQMQWPGCITGITWISNEGSVDICFEKNRHIKITLLFFPRLDLLDLLDNLGSFEDL